MGDVERRVRRDGENHVPRPASATPRQWLGRRTSMEFSARYCREAVAIEHSPLAGLSALFNTDRHPSDASNIAQGVDHVPAPSNIPHLPTRVVRSRRFTVGLTVIALLIGSAVTPASANARPLADTLRTWVPTGDFASSSFDRVPQAAPDPVPAGDRRLSLSVVRGGHASAQLAVTSAQDLEKLRVQVDPLKPTGEGGAISKKIQVRYPQYIPNSPNAPGGVIADPLRGVDTVDVPAGMVQPVWFTFDVPETARPGTYHSRIVVRAQHARAVTYDLTVKVADVTLPPPAQRNFYLNVWFQPDTIADQLHLPLWSDAHFAALRPYLADLAEHGQRVVNTAAVTDPWPLERPDGSWHSQTYIPWHSLISWSYNGEDWSFDFRNWDRFVAESLASGIGPQISVFGLLGFGGPPPHLTYTDTRTNSEVWEWVDLGGQRWTDAWSAFLVTFEEHLRTKGWLHQTHLAFDERPTNEMQVAFDLVQKYAPDLAANRFAIAGGESSDPLANELSLNEGSRSSWPQELIDKRKAEGKKTTFYTWNQPIHPNTLTQSPPVGARLLPWISAQRNLDGYLRWSYNSWPQDPYTNPTFMGVTFPNFGKYRPGDEYLVYPGPNGPVSSIRWELFRDGQEDFALLDQLAQLGGADNPVRLQALQDVDTSRTLPTADTYKNLLDSRAAVIHEIERLTSR
ncbi:DUF4091 domain-containing protein [Nonomuraea sp. K274]|uniref:DUF4091 domain-containing protein n=1 Tax=Nonomuraea cypriaca TaxID=1187855 RepID=A0A931A5G0_9ACTN|nr:DUF4091 domain-containing protein [Nonomuraea cypriaca]MBF8185094.1 DUF4091 domain-containing protein [Nonomuraea cypriaca]